MNAKLQAAREFIIAGQFDVARAMLATMPDSPTAQKWLANLDETAPVRASAPASVEETKVDRWEYIEVFVEAEERLPANLENLMDGKQLTTVDHFYTQILNDYGAQGWELVSEELFGGGHVRLLFKRVAEA